MDSMKSCGGSTLPLVSGARTKQMNLPSGDQRGCESLGPAVICRDSPVAVDTVQMAVLYPSFRSLTVTRRNAMREPSGETCGSAIQTKLNRSFSAMFRFCAKTGPAKRVIDTRMSSTRDFIRVSFRKRNGERADILM